MRPISPSPISSPTCARPRPSAAAELVVGKKDEFLSRIDFLRHGLHAPYGKAAARKKIRAAAAARCDSALADFPGRLQELAQRLDGGEFALARLFQQSLNRKLGRWNRSAQRFAAFDLGAPAEKQRACRSQNLRMQVGRPLRRTAAAAAGNDRGAGLQAGRHEPGIASWPRAIPSPPTASSGWSGTPPPWPLMSRSASALPAAQAAAKVIKE